MKSLFYKPVKINHPDEDVFISSDFHLHQLCDRWENPLWHQRGFNAVQSHSDGIIDNWNSLVKSSSVAFLLGDSIFQNNGKEKMLDMLNRLNFHHLYLSRGNHGSGWDQIFSEIPDNILQIGDKTVIFCPNYFEAIINRQSVVFSHYFVAAWNGQNSSKGGSYMLHGHSHQNLLKGELAPYIAKVRAMDVGVDATGFPFSFSEIKNKLNNITPYAPDHHSALTNNPF